MTDHRYVQIEMVDIRCGKCDVIFGMERRYYEARLNDGATWYCPNGHGRHWDPGKYSDKAKLVSAREELERAKTENVLLQREKSRVSKQFMGLRKRVFNGVCPCCTRSFPHLMAHMRTKHPDYLTAPTSMCELRKIFGMTQAEVGNEAYVNAVYVSKFERGHKDIPEQSRKRLEYWMKRYVGAEETV